MDRRQLLGGKAIVKEQGANGVVILEFLVNLKRLLADLIGYRRSIALDPVYIPRPDSKGKLPDTDVNLVRASAG